MVYWETQTASTPYKKSDSTEAYIKIENKTTAKQNWIVCGDMDIIAPGVTPLMTPEELLLQGR